jgi:hypothetical protein
MKKRMLDLIDSSIGSHQDEENSGFIDLIDPAFDYLSEQLEFFLNQFRLRWTVQYIRFISYQDNYKLIKIRAHARLTSGHIRTILKF